MPLTPIGDVRMVCPLCGWRGILDNTEPDADGDGSPGCPVPDCGGLVTEVLN